MKNISQYEKPDAFSTAVQFMGLAFMFGGMFIGDVLFDQIIVGFFVGFAMFLGLIVSYIRRTGAWNEGIRKSV